ncbi:MAG: hypothetical protein ACE5JI_01610 [Acidobacteriota bacterium]
MSRFPARHELPPRRRQGTRRRAKRRLPAGWGWGWGLGGLTAPSLLFVAATVFLTYPQALHPASLGRFDNGDARLNAWAMSWVAHQIVTDPFRLFEANTFHPLPHSLAYSEHLLVQGLLALPLLRLTNDLVLSYNLVLLFSIFLSALGMYLLTVSLTGSRLAGLLTGLFFAFAPYRFNRLPHIQMQLYAFIPLALAALHRFLETGRRCWAWAFAALLVLQALSGTYLAAMAAVAAGLALLTLVPRGGLSRSSLATLLLALSLAALAIFPFARPYLWVHRTLGVEWDLPGIGSLSARPATYLASSSHLYRGLSESLLGPESRTDFLFPGLTLLVLATVGAVVLLSRQSGCSRPRALLACYGLILLTGFLLSLGPHGPLYPVLHEHVVFFRGLRALTRFGLLPLFSLSVLSGFALAWFFEGAGRLRRRRWAAAAIGGFFIVESSAAPYGLTEFRDDPPEVYTWLAQEAEPGTILELPFRVIDTRYMFWARHHRFRPTLNGDSGFIPVPHQWMKVLFQRFPSPDSTALLERLRVRYVVLHLGAFRDRARLRLLVGMERYREHFLPVRDFGRALVYEVVATEPRVPPPGSGEHPVAVHAGAMATALVDGITDVPWQPPPGRAECELALGSPRLISGLRIHYGPRPRVPVDQLEILLPDGEHGWKPQYRTPPHWPALTELVLGLLANPRDGTQTVHFHPVKAARLLLRFHGFEAPPQITEIELLESPIPTENGKPQHPAEAERSVE